jgi:hypothetical protein
MHLGCFDVFVGGSVFQNGRDQVLQLTGAGGFSDIILPGTSD